MCSAGSGEQGEPFSKGELEPPPDPAGHCTDRHEANPLPALHGLVPPLSSTCCPSRAQVKGNNNMSSSKQLRAALRVGLEE